MGLDVHTPRDWIRRAEVMDSHCVSLLKKLTTNHSLTGRENICLSHDPAELCRSVHPNIEHRRAATKAVEKVSNYVHRLNTDVQVYRSMKRASEEYEGEEGEERDVIVSLVKESEVSGIHLPDAERDQVVDLHGRIQQLGHIFQQNIHTPDERHLLVTEEQAKSLPGSIVERRGRDLYVSGDYADHVLQHSRDSELRKKAYIMSLTAVPNNVAVVEDILELRGRLSKVLGFKSYAESVLSNHRMMSSPRQIHDFLLELSHKIRPLARQELKVLEEMKKKEDPQGGEPWDVKFYSKLFSDSQKVGKVELREYLGRDRCIDALDVLTSHLFGINTQRIPFEKKLRLSEGGNEIGIVYLDLYNREDKIGNFATHAIRFPVVDEQGELVETPRVTLVGNMEDNKQWSHSDLETLFHEFGHCLASLLSRTKMYHLSGTRCPLDFAEFPSTLFENFAWDYRVLSLFAQHKDTGEVLPQSVWESFVQSKRAFRLTETEMQIANAIFDLEVHGAWPLALSTTELLHEIRSKYTSIPHARETHWHSTFGHLIDYASGYYSYLYSRVLSTAVWQYRFAEEPLDREEGERLRRMILEYGGTGDTMTLFQRYLGNSLRTSIALTVVTTVRHKTKSVRDHGRTK
ncbi:mitochondrial intermediate peptidase [Planoprotostelium fungivorum]|uniref:Mitochondrial intermediate peptidase n=1 Tax=Planoprotostelium fungivorum TaxID=1890364 RepID=A0A2P6MXG6_9EUKA|nr:mitochondrial intermediate peptidase [Planoprotostelium fungivorum]